METSAKSGLEARVLSEFPRRASSSSRFGSPHLALTQGEGDASHPTSSLVCWSHPEWTQRFPWLVQGTTGKSPGADGGDFRLFGEGDVSENEKNWQTLALSHGFSGIVHGRQVHGMQVSLHAGPPSGLAIGADADGHASSAPGALMAVTVADCVPVFLVDPHHRVGAVLHAGWRGAEAGVLERGLEVLADEFGSEPQNVLMHLGPAICGSCYEVGPEVHVALGLPEPPGPAPVNLRAVLVEQAVERGLLRAQITRSWFCTLCHGSPFFSHRRGEAQRQVGFIGLRSS
jgi:YfiH family protein